MSENPASPQAPDRPGEVILFCLVGLSPAVVTETVWALAHEAEPVVPDRVIVCTTTMGRALLNERLFAGGQWAEFVRRLEAHAGVGVGDRLRFGPVGESVRVVPAFARDRELADIVSTEDNHAVADFLLENLRPFTENAGCTVVASIAGGRKTMGALLLSAMALLGREGDRV